MNLVGRLLTIRLDNVIRLMNIARSLRFNSIYDSKISCYCCIVFFFFIFANKYYEIQIIK